MALDQIVTIGLYSGLAALAGGAIAVKKVLKERQNALDKEERRQSIARYDAQQKAIAEKSARNAAEAREAERLLKQREEQKRKRQEAKEKEELVGCIQEAIQNHWLYPSNGLLVGSFDANPLEGQKKHLPKCLRPLPDHLSAYNDYRATLPVWFEGEEMGITIGGAGSRKFTAAVAPNVLIYDGSCFIVDPKGEICAVTAYARKHYHQQAVYRLDPFDETDFAPDAYAPPLSSYNPLDALDPASLTFADDAVTLAEALCVESSDPFWADSAKQLIAPLLMFVRSCPSYKDDERNLSKVYQLLAAPADEVSWLLGEMSKSPYVIVRACGNSFKGMDDRTSSGIWQQARTALYIFSLPAIEKVTATSSFKLDDLFTQHCTLYLILPANRLKSHNRWLRLMLTVSVMVATQHKNKASRSLWIVDEAAQLGKLDAIPNAYALLRGYGIRIWTFWQDLGQLKATYPEQWTSFLANSFVQVMAVGDLDTAKYFSEMGGKIEKEKITKAKMIGWGDSQSNGGGSGDSNGDTGSTTDSDGTSQTYRGWLGLATGDRSVNHNTSSSSGWQRSVNRNVNWSASQSRNFSETTTIAWQWEDAIPLNVLSGMPKNRMYLRCPNQIAGFIDKLPYHDHVDLNALAQRNPYFENKVVKRLPINPRRLEAS